MHAHEIIFENVTGTSAAEAMARWFAGSKIVDASGKPLILYHGTSKDVDFKVFKAPKNGIWFTKDPASASEYAVDNDSMNTKYDFSTGRFVKTNTASRVIPVFVRATNPAFFATFPEELRHLDAGESGVGYRRGQAAFFERLRAKGHDAMVVGGGDLVVAFSPEQIKSAIGNKTFDPKKKGITEGGSNRPARHG